ncbi:MAG: putative two-component system sensor kinase, partial [Actinomycetia bacterium]|nr:putative two-component system sensor kinase [Actinomycetes bacterium]
MVAGLGGGYRERMTWLNKARDWRPTLHVLAGMAAGAGVGAVLAGLVVIWLAAIWSLIDGPVGGWELAVLYSAVALAGPVLLLWAVRGFGALQRARFRTVLGIEIPAPPRGAGGGFPLLRPVRAWRAPATWRQLGYHLLALVGGTAGGALVAACWSAPVLAIAYLAGRLGDGRRLGLGLGAAVLAAAMLLVAPRVARVVARADEAAGRALLGPSRGEELAVRVESLARSRAEIVAATDAERRRIERDLHDGTQRRLVSLAMHLTDAPEPVRQVIEQAHDEATEALAELRQLVRGLHPAVLDDRGLDAALSGIAANAPLPVRLRVDAPTRCAPGVEAVAYFVVSEALTNVAKHAGASHAEVTVERTGDRLRIVVSDDGRGGATLDSGGTAANGNGTGLRGLAQRAAAVDGTLTVES